MSHLFVAKSRLRSRFQTNETTRIRIAYVSNKKNYVTVSSAATKVVEPVKVFVAVFLSRPTILPRSLQRVEKCTRCAECAGTDIFVNRTDLDRGSSVHHSRSSCVHGSTLESLETPNAPISATFHVRLSYQSKRSPSWKPISFSFYPPFSNRPKSPT